MSEQSDQFVGLVVGVTDQIGQILALERHAEYVESGFPRFSGQFGADVIYHLRCGRSGECQDRDAGQQLADVGNFEVGRAEVVAPLRDAMRFVNGDKRYAHVAQLGLKQAAAQSFRRNVKQFDAAQDTVLKYAQDVVMLQSGINGLCSDANLPEVVHLILHQGNERRDDNARTFHSHSRHLEGDGLATTRRHQA